MKRYMVIEKFNEESRQLIYSRFHRCGRMLPEGLYYLDSWLEKDGDRCFQLMETDNASLFHEWIAKWSDLARFEVIELGEKPGPEDA